LNKRMVAQISLYRGALHYLWRRSRAGRSAHRRGKVFYFLIGLMQRRNFL
jgi:hypothetical protein